MDRVWTSEEIEDALSASDPLPPFRGTWDLPHTWETRWAK